MQPWERGAVKKEIQSKGKIEMQAWRRWGVWVLWGMVGWTSAPAEAETPIHKKRPKEVVERKAPKAGSRLEQTDVANQQIRRLWSSTSKGLEALRKWAMAFQRWSLHQQRQEKKQRQALQKQITNQSKEIVELKQRLRQLEHRLASPRQRALSTSRPKRVSQVVPFRLRAQEYSKGYFSLTFLFARPVLQIWYKLKKMRDFRSTGFHSFRHPITQKKMPQMTVMTRLLHVGENAFWLRYQDQHGRVFGPVQATVTIAPKEVTDADSFVRYQWRNPIMRQLRFRMYRGEAWLMPLWISQTSIFREIRYSMDSKSLGRFFVQGGKAPKASFLRVSLSPGRHTLSLKGTLHNGWSTGLVQYSFFLKDDGRWYTTHPIDK